MIQSFPKGFIKTQKTKTYTEYKVKGTGSVTVFVERPTHPPEDRTGDYTQGLSLQPRLPGWDRPDSPQHPGPFASWGLYQARGRPLSAGPDAGLGASVCSLILPRTDARAGGWGDRCMGRGVGPSPQPQAQRSHRRLRLPAQYQGFRTHTHPTGPF